MMLMTRLKKKIHIYIGQRLINKGSFGAAGPSRPITNNLWSCRRARKREMYRDDARAMLYTLPQNRTSFCLLMCEREREKETGQSCNFGCTRKSRCGERQFRLKSRRADYLSLKNSLLLFWPNESLSLSLFLSLALPWLINNLYRA